jgi:YHS domain-containing protein
MKWLIGSLCTLGLLGCGKESSAPAPTASPAAAPVSASAALPAGMTRIGDPSQVCMVNDQFMGKPQIPVQVEGRTYYGCCPACKERLETQPAIRTATDPVTGEEVDKARAVIVQDASGKIFYFASEASLQRYRG